MEQNLAWAEEAGLLNGGKPEEFVTREEVANMIQQALNCFFERIIRTLQEN